MLKIFQMKQKKIISQKIFKKFRKTCLEHVIQSQASLCFDVTHNTCYLNLQYQFVSNVLCRIVRGNYPRLNLLLDML